MFHNSYAFSLFFFPQKALLAFYMLTCSLKYALYGEFAGAAEGNLVIV